MNNQGIVALFVTETLICATIGVELKGYMMKKHGWNEEKWKEYFIFYRTLFDKIMVENEDGRPMKIY